MSVNKVILLGRLGIDPELRYTQGGQPVCTFRMATSETWGTGDDRKERTEWHSIVVWGRKGEVAAEYLAKGREVYVEGRLQTRKWQGKDGTDRYTTEVVARDVVFVGGRGGGSKGSYDGPPPPQDEDMGQAVNDDDDIPF